MKGQMRRSSNSPAPVTTHGTAHTAMRSSGNGCSGNARGAGERTGRGTIPRCHVLRVFPRRRNDRGRLFVDDGAAAAGAGVVGGAGADLVARRRHALDRSRLFRVARTAL